jgi:hypothetical protein
MDVLKEQRVCIKFCQNLGKTATKTYEMLQQAFGESVESVQDIFVEESEASPVTFFVMEGLVYHEFLPQRQTMNQTAT